MDSDFECRILTFPLISIEIFIFSLSLKTLDFYQKIAKDTCVNGIGRKERMMKKEEKRHRERASIVDEQE